MYSSDMVGNGRQGNGLHWRPRTCTDLWLLIHRLPVKNDAPTLSMLVYTTDIMFC